MSTAIDEKQEAVPLDLRINEGMTVSYRSQCMECGPGVGTEAAGDGKRCKKCGYTGSEFDPWWKGPALGFYLGRVGIHHEGGKWVVDGDVRTPEDAANMAACLMRLWEAMKRS